MALVSQPVLAETPAAATAEVLFRDGRESMKKGDFQAAMENFAESYRLDPSIGTLLNLALCEEKTGRLTGAWLHLRELLEKAPEQDERRPLARRRLADLDRRIPRLTIVLHPAKPPPASIRLDGTVIGRVSTGVPLPVDPGEHELTVASPHGAEKKQVASLSEGQSFVMVAESPPEESTVPAAVKIESAPSVPPTQASDREDGSRRTTGIVFAGAGLAALVASIFPTLAMLHEKKEMDAHCVNGCDPRGFEAASAGRTWNAVATTTAATGLVSLGVGGYFLLFGARAKEPPRGSTAYPVVVGAQLNVDGDTRVAVDVRF
jgi:hypothetical protein